MKHNAATTKLSVSKPPPTRGRRSAFVCLMQMLAPAVCAASTGPAALVIGNTTYPSLPPLPACAASAHVVSAALQRAGFAVTEKTDASNGEMGAAIADFATAAGAAPAQGEVIYACGYALDFQGRAFLLPASATIERETDVLTQGLAAGTVVRALVRAGTQSGLVLLDTAMAPKATAPQFDATAASAGPKVGFGAYVSAEAPPSGATPFAAAIAAAFAAPQVEAGAVLRAVAAHVTISSAIPPAPVWLVGTPAAAPAPAPVAPPDEAHMTDADRRAVQSALLRLGYYDKPVDGVFGADTRAAIRRYQHELHTDMTGTLTPPQTARLLGGG